MSLVDFHCAEYSDCKTVADQEQRKRLVEIGIRNTARATKTDSKTIMLINRSGARETEHLGENTSISRKTGELNPCRTKTQNINASGNENIAKNEMRGEGNPCRSRSPEPSGVDALLPDPNSAQVPLTSMNVAIGVMMGLAFLLTVFIAMWCFRSSTDPVAST